MMSEDTVEHEKQKTPSQTISIRVTFSHILTAAHFKVRCFHPTSHCLTSQITYKMFRLDKYTPSAWLLGSVVYFQLGHLFHREK